MSKIIEGKLAFITLVLIYRLALDYIYVFTIAPLFSYANFTYEPDTYSQSFSWIAFIVGLVLFMPFRKTSGNFLNQSILLFYLLSYVPMTSYWWCKGQSSSFMIANMVFWCLFIITTKRLKGIDLTKYFSHNDKIVTLLTILMAAVILFISGYYAHFRIHLSFDDVYDLRHEARGFNMPLILRYIWNASANVLPVCMIYFLEKKKYPFAWALAFVVLLNFSIAGMKSALFKMLICVALYYCRKWDVSKLLLILFVALSLITIGEYLYNESSVLSVMFIRRGLYMPNLLDELFYDFISNHEPTYYQPQSTEMTFAIGDVYFNNEGMRCNNGWFTDAFVNLGWIGVLIYPFIFAFLFKTCERSFRNVNKLASFFAAFIIVTTLRSSLLTTSLITHGILLLILTMMFISQSFADTANEKINNNK